DAVARQEAVRRMVEAERRAEQVEANALHFRQRAIDAEAKVRAAGSLVPHIRLEAVSLRYDTVRSGARSGTADALDVIADALAALRAASPADVSAPHPDAESGPGGRTEGVTGWQRGFDADAVQP